MYTFAFVITEVLRIDHSVLRRVILTHMNTMQQQNNTTILKYMTTGSNLHDNINTVQNKVHLEMKQ